jgi:hypothetical protein
MRDNPLFDPEKIILNELKMIKFHIDTSDSFDQGGVTGFQWDNSLLLSFDLIDELARADFNITIQSKSKLLNQTESVGHFHFQFIYQIENLKELAIAAKKERLEVNTALSNALASITYSTARGIIFSRLQGTALQNFILPVINTNNLVVAH